MFLFLLLVRKPLKPQYRHVFSPNWSPNISYATIGRIYSIIKALPFVISSFILTPCTIVEIVKLRRNYMLVEVRNLRVKEVSL